MRWQERWQYHPMLRLRLEDFEGIYHSGDRRGGEVRW
jgi:hypothetical protein